MTESDTKGLSHGLVTGSIPEQVLLKFQKVSQKARDKVVSDIAAEGSGSVEPPTGVAVNAVDMERVVGRARREMKSQAGRIFEMEAEVESGDRSEESAEDADSDVEMADWLTHSPGAGISQNEIDLHRRVDLQRGERARASGTGSAPTPALPVSSILPS